MLDNEDEQGNQVVDRFYNIIAGDVHGTITLLVNEHRRDLLTLLIPGVIVTVSTTTTTTAPSPFNLHS